MIDDEFLGKLSRMRDRDSDDAGDPLEKFHLAPPDGKRRILMLNTPMELGADGFECVSEYTDKINDILIALQSGGYAIVDVQYNSCERESGLEPSKGCTLITYR